MAAAAAVVVVVSLSWSAVVEGACQIAPDAATGRVVVPFPTAEIATAAYNACLTLVSVSLPNSVTRIGEFAFSRCPLLSARSPSRRR